MSDRERFSRQERLTEVGPGGQDRIGRMSVVVRGEQGAGVEQAYLLGAGVPRVTLRADEAAEPFAHEGAFQFEAARAVGGGAWRALGELRRAILAGRER